MHTLILSDTFPNRIEPWRGPYNRRQIECLADLCKVTVINPLPWTRVLSRPRLLSLVLRNEDGEKDLKSRLEVLLVLAESLKERVWEALKPKEKPDFMIGVHDG